MGIRTGPKVLRCPGCGDDGTPDRSLDDELMMEKSLTGDWGRSGPLRWVCKRCALRIEIRAAIRGTDG